MDFAKAALAHVIASAQHQRAIGGFSLVVIGKRHRRRAEGIDDDQVFLERRGLRDQLSARIQRQRGAVEDKAVVAANLVATSAPGCRLAGRWQRASRGEWCAYGASKAKMKG